MNTATMNGEPTATIITQEYYDEVCLENVEVFGLSESEAIIETEEQLQNQSASTSASPSSPTEDPATVLFGHLSRTFPTSDDGMQERSEIEAFKNDLAFLLGICKDDGKTNDNPIHNDSDIAKVLQRIGDRVQDKPLLYLSVFHVCNGFESVVQLSTQLWTKWAKEQMPSIPQTSTTLESLCEHSLTTLKTCIQQIQKLASSKTIPASLKRNWMVAFHESVAASSWTYHNRIATASDARVSPLDAWLNALAYQTVSGGKNDANTEWNGGLVQDLLLLIFHAVKNFEANKQYLMQAQTQQQQPDGDSYLVSYKLFMKILEYIIARPSQDSQMDVSRRLCRSMCRLITCLCTFEPDLIVSKPVDGAPPMVSSAHANVMCFHQEEFVFKLHQLLQTLYHPMRAHPEPQGNKDVMVDSYVVLALRAMAINNEIVQAVVAVGLLKEARHILLGVANLSDDNGTSNEEQIKEKDATKAKPTDVSDDIVQSLVAVVGLFRNVCANDEVKTSLCIGKDQSIVEPLLSVMRKYYQQAALQEHGCGTFAAMALRKPENAQFLVHQHQAHLAVLKAMQQHPNRAALQRQGALCLRNMVSRSPQLKPILVDQAQAGQVLLQIAAQHVSCQDEVYAALRDLGVEGVGIMNVRQDEGTGQVTMERTQMFGEGIAAEAISAGGRSSNFRPVYD